MGQSSLAVREPGVQQNFDAVHAQMLCFFPDLVLELGGDPQALFLLAGLNPHSVSTAGIDASYRQVVHLMELAAAELRCPDFGMRLARLQRGGTMFGPLGHVMRNSATFGDALAYVMVHNYAHSLAVRLWLTHCPAEGTFFAGHDMLLDQLPNTCQVTEQIILLGHQTAMELTDGYARGRRIHFRHQPIAPIASYRRYFGCDVLFSQNEDGLVFAERDLARKIVAPDPQAYWRAASYIDTEFTCHHPPLRAQVRGVIRQLLGTEECANERVAEELHLHPRTLHRRLAAEGTSFQRIRDEVRRDVMLYYLRQTDVGLAHISEKLGFAEQSIMTRRCHRWLSASPTQVRSQGRARASLA
jgi:AraC-like DNA-binding protein